jgi:hypothetical protein
MSGRTRRLTLAAGLLVMLPTLASAQHVTSRDVPPGHGAPQIACGQRADIERMLKEQYGERQRAHGLASSGALAEIFTSPKGTWTIIATSPNGVSCMIGSGESWQTTLAADDTI